MSFYGKVFKYHSSDNHDAFLSSLGLPSETLGFFMNFKSDQKIEKSGDTYIYTFNTPRGDKPLPFTSGIEFQDQVRDISITNTFLVDENCVTHKMKLDPGLVITSKKQFLATKMTEEITNSNWDGVAYVTYNV